MSRDAVVVLVVAGALLLVVRRRAAIAAATPMFPQSLNTNDNIASPAESALYWSMAAQGVPSLLQSRGAGSVSPATSTIGGGPWWRGGRLWAPRTAGEAATAPEVAAPPGRFLFPGPGLPGAPTPQSSVESTSPYLPLDLRLMAPLAMNPWYYQLSAINPSLALAPGAGGYIDVKRVR